MELIGEHTFSAPRERVWQFMLDPEVLKACLPGCEKLEEIGPDEYAATMKIGVAMIPGWTEFTRIPSRSCAHSSAIDLANSRTAPLVAEYPANPADPRSPATDDSITSDPPDPDFRISGIEYFAVRNTPALTIEAACR